MHSLPKLCAAFHSLSLCGFYIIKKKKYSKQWKIVKLFFETKGGVLSRTSQKHLKNDSENSCVMYVLNFYEWRMRPKGKTAVWTKKMLCFCCNLKSMIYMHNKICKSKFQNIISVLDTGRKSLKYTKIFIFSTQCFDLFL